LESIGEDEINVYAEGKQNFTEKAHQVWMRRPRAETAYTRWRERDIERNEPILRHNELCSLDRISDGDSKREEQY